MRKLCFSLTAALMAVFLYLPAAQAQRAACTTTTEARASLSVKHKEAPVVMGILPNGNVMEIWRNSDGSTFSVTISDPQGRTCLVANGSSLQNVDWNLAPVQPKGPKA